MEVSLRDMIDHCRFLGLEPVLEVAATSEFDRVMEITRLDEKLIVGSTTVISRRSRWT